MIERAADRLFVDVPMVMGNAKALLAAGETVLPAKGAALLDFDRVREADSSALAVMLAWLRRASQQGVQVSFANVPQGVRTLAELYGVTELLPLV